MLKAIFLDLFGTVFDLSQTPRSEIRAYIDQCVDPVWRPLELPVEWADLPAFPDAQEGLGRLMNKYEVATLSNATFPLTLDMLDNNKLPVSGVVRLERIKRYKPHPECYLRACRQFLASPERCMMVTANPTFGPYPFGDIQIAGAIGMQTRLIRNPGGPADIIALAEDLGC